MKVRLTRTGGFAGTRLSAELDSATLPEDKARRLHDLVAASGVLARGGAQPKAARSADRFSYRLTVDGGEGERTYDVAEQDVDADLAPLIDWLVSSARERTV